MNEQKGNFVIEVMANEDGQLYMGKVAMNDYQWLGHILAMGQFDYLERCEIDDTDEAGGLNVDDDGNVLVTPIVDKMATFIYGQEWFFGDLLENNVTDLEVSGQIMEFLHKAMQNVDYASGEWRIQAWAWSVEVDMCVTFLVTINP